MLSFFRSFCDVVYDQTPTSLSKQTPTSVPTPEKKDDVTYFYSKIDPNIVQPTDQPYLYNPSNYMFHAEYDQTNSYSIGTEIPIDKRLSMYSRFIFYNGSNDRNDLSLRWYPVFDPSKSTFKRQHGKFMSIGFSCGKTDNIDFLIGTKAYIGENVTNCPLTLTAYMGPSYFCGESRLSMLIGGFVGVEI